MPMRRIPGSTQSPQDNRSVERILSEGETLRLQDRPGLDYLIRAATAARHGHATPPILPASGPLSTATPKYQTATR
jgi:hypothetical protein